MSQLRILLLTNALSRKGQQSDAIIREKLTSLEFIIANQETFEPADFASAVSKYAAQIDAVVVGGGDGSMNAALPGLIKHNLPLGVLPLGTSNNLSRNLGIPLDLESACKVIHEGAQKRIDLGKVNGFYFLNVAGMGVSNKVNKTVPSMFKRYFGMIAYIFTAFKVFRSYRRFRAEIETSEGTVCLKTIQISVCNGQFFASGVKISPNAVIDDGLLDLCSIRVKSWLEVPKVVRDFKRGVVDEEHSAFLKKDKSFTIRTSRTIKVDTDGEIRTKTPAKFEIVPQALTVFIPKL